MKRKEKSGHAMTAPLNKIELLSPRPTSCADYIGHPRGIQSASVSSELELLRDDLAGFEEVVRGTQDDLWLNSAFAGHYMLLQSSAEVLTTAAKHERELRRLRILEETGQDPDRTIEPQRAEVRKTGLELEISREKCALIRRQVRQFNAELVSIEGGLSDGH